MLGGRAFVRPRPTPPGRGTCVLQGPRCASRAASCHGEDTAALGPWAPEVPKQGAERGQSSWDRVLTKVQMLAFGEKEVKALTALVGRVL